MSKPIICQELETLAVIVSSLIMTVVANELDKKISNRTGTATAKRERVEVDDVFDRLGLTHSKHAYRMCADSFFKLYKNLCKCNPNINRR